MPKNRESLPGEAEHCDQCRATGGELMLCHGCKSVSYCSRDCQRLAWKAHKKVCRMIADGVNWQLLSPLQRRGLRKHHISTGCTDPWPLASAEVPEMLQPPFPSFLCVHPNQRFKIVIEELPSFRIEMPGADVHGMHFPSGQRLPLLSECITDSTNAYLAQVPNHFPQPSVYAVIGQVVWTKGCQRELAAFYDHGGSGGDGKFFRWPGGDAIGICPATGTAVRTDGRTPHLLVVCEMQGCKAIGTGLHQCFRLLPRILTREGYMRMVREGERNCVRTLRSAASGEVVEDSVPFFPEGLRYFSAWGDKVVPASQGWSTWHAQGAYAAYERLLEDKRRASGTAELMSSAFHSPCRVEGRSSGPSTYTPEPQARDTSGKYDPSLIAPGTPLRIKGLGSRADLNGRHATALEWDAQAERLAVIVRSLGFGEEARVKLKPSNFVLEWATPDQPDPLTGGPCPCCHETQMHTPVGSQQNAGLQFCCGKAVCHGCLIKVSLGPRLQRDRCPLCGEDTSDTSDTNLIRQLKRHAHPGGAPTCLYNLAAYYDHGHHGLRRDCTEARRLYELAAKQGHRRAAHCLGCSHRDGEGGPVSLAEAAHWFRVSAELGHVPAQCNLGLAYQRGQGVQVDAEEAFKWLSMAARAGDELARRALGVSGR